MKDRGGGDWLRQGQGRTPDLAWSFATEAPLVAMKWARETGDLLLADAVGGMYLLDRAGKLLNLTRGPSPIRALGFSDTGAGGVALVGDDKLYWFNRQLTFQGCLEHADQVASIALEPFGQYAAVSLADGQLIIYDWYRKRVRSAQTPHPLVALEFVPTAAELVGVAEYGMLCRLKFTGETIHHKQLWSNVGDLAVARGGETVLLACYAHGVQLHDSHGEQIGSFQVGGTACRTSASFSGRKLACATMERHFYFIDSDGPVEWQAILPDDVCRIACDPLGQSVVIGFQSGRVVRLDWKKTE